MKACCYCKEDVHLELKTSWSGDVWVRCKRCQAEGPHCCLEKQVLAIQAWNGECTITVKNPHLDGE